MNNFRPGFFLVIQNFLFRAKRNKTIFLFEIWEGVCAPENCSSVNGWTYYLEIVSFFYVSIDFRNFSGVFC